jgi:nitrate/nitrite transport system substrate-binding protein
MDRRRFIQLGAGAAGVTALGSLLAACGSDSGETSTSGPSTTSSSTSTTTAVDGTTSTTAGAATTSTTARAAKAASQQATTTTQKVSGPPRKVTLGFIALTDAAPLIMAKELGYFAERGLDVTLVKQASWPATRDNLLSGQIDGAHCLSTMPYSVASGISGSSTDLKIAMILNNNGQAITLSNEYKAAAYGNLAEAKKVLESKEPTLAMTYPGGTHDLWLRYWLKATKADPTKVKIIAIPPPQMVANMKVDTMDGFCVGEPWNAVAVQQSIGFTHLATQDIWLHHPEKALVVNPKMAADTAVMQQLMGATLQACKWLDDMGNRAKCATTIGAPAYINAPAADIQGRLLGKYDLGAGLGTKDFQGEQMLFFRDGQTNFPRRSYGVWALAQYQRLGLLKSAPDYKVIDSIVLTDLYAKVAEAEKIAIPNDDMKPFEVRLDGATFDPKKPADEAARA